MATRRLGIIMNGVTGRMGYNQHLVRSILAIREAGGVALSNGDRVMPDPILVGRNAEKVEALARAHGISRWTTDLDAALADPNDELFFDAATTQLRAELVGKALDAGKHVYCEKPVAESLPERRDRVPGMWECLRHPVRCFETLRISHDKAGTRLRRCGLAGLAGCASLALSVMVSDLVAGASLILLGPAIVLLCVVGFEFLSLIESRGLRIIGRTRGFRITPAISQSVTTAASSWWIVAGIGLGLGAAVVSSGLAVARPGPPFWTPARAILLAGSVLVFCFGFLMFETMAYLGLRRCRFANRLRPAPLIDGEGARVEQIEKNAEARR